MAERTYSLDSMVTAIDIHGRHYSRKILTGLKRGEFYLQRGTLNGEPICFQTAEPSGFWATHMPTGKSVWKPIEDGTRLCWLLSEDAYNEVASMYERQPRSAAQRDSAQSTKTSDGNS